MITIVVTSQMFLKTLDACPMFFWGEVFPNGGFFKLAKI
jgi:hypothetical protein